MFNLTKIIIIFYSIIKSYSNFISRIYKFYRKSVNYNELVSKKTFKLDFKVYVFLIFSYF